jgi:hypothetical protein
MLYDCPPALPLPRFVLADLLGEGVGGVPAEHDRRARHPPPDIQQAGYPAPCFPSGELAAERCKWGRAVRDLATEYGVSYDTIRRATALLRDRGLIITIVGRGTYVSPDSE